MTDAKPTTAVAALAAAIDTVGVADASEHIRSADDLAPALLSHLDTLGWRLVQTETDPADEPRTHGSRYGRAHRSLRQHLVEDHAGSNGWTWAALAGVSDDAAHDWHDNWHGTTWAHTKDLPHRYAGDGRPPATPTVADAAALAAGAHHGQVDKAGKPYIDHPRAVAALLADRGTHAVMAGWLHDVVEDSDVSLHDLEAAGYPAEVVAAVDAVTRRDGEPYMEMIRRAAADPLGRLVKLADNAHNSRPDRLALLPKDDVKRLRRKYDRARLTLTAEPVTR